MKWRWSTLAGLLFVLGAVSFLWWRAQFGAELYDEPLYLAPGFKLFDLGDTPLANEAHNGLRQYDVLNHLLVAPFIKFEVLPLRRLAVVVYASLLGLFTWLCFRRRWGLAAGLCFAACLIFDHFLFATWSHNWWVRNLCLVHHCLILGGSSKNERLRMLLAGAALGLVVFAYHPLALGVGLVLLGIVALALFGRLKDQTQIAGAYGAGLLAVGAGSVLYLGQEPMRSAWLHAVSVNVLDYTSGKKIGTDKMKNVLMLLVFSREVWLMGILLALGSKSQAIYSKLKITHALRERIRAGFAAIFALFLLKRVWSSEHFFMISQLFIGLGAAGGFWHLVRPEGEKRLRTLLLVALPIVLLVNMSFVSHNSHHALFWLIPLLLTPFVAQQLQAGGGDKFAAVRFTLLLGALAVVLTGAIRYSLGQTYFDAPPAQCLTRIESGPLKGIFTTARRAELMGELARATQGKHFALSVGLPGAFYFGQLRSAGDTTTLNPSFPLEVVRGAFETMIKEERFPDLVIIERQNNWGWGLDPIPTSLEASHPYARFARCVNRGLMMDFPEFYVLDADPARAGVCAANALDLELHRDIS